jgi:hypothetical protein
LEKLTDQWVGSRGRIAIVVQHLASYPLDLINGQD